MSGRFRDPIHGMIQLNKGELEIVNSPVFQRLRYIRQLGTSFLVYHGAEHTRFGHSLGVAALVGKAMDILKQKQPEPLADDEYENLKQVVRIVALLHDIGHAPFSHVGEDSGLFPLVEDYDGEMVSGHEVYSRLIVRDYFKEIIEKNFPNIKTEEVLSFMKGNITNSRYFFAKDLINSQLDMDRMDYLLRDSHYCGVKYGLFDLSRLLDTLTICESQNEVWQLGVDSDGVQAVEEFVFARYWMFIQVYFHKTRRIFDYFLIKFLKQFLENEVYPKNLDKYLKYNDNKILEAISNSDIKWAQYLWKRDHLREAFVSSPHQISLVGNNKGIMGKDLEFNDYHKLGWIDEEFKKSFPHETEPENYFIDQAKTASAKEHIEMRTIIEEDIPEDEENRVTEKQLYAIPIKDKHTNVIRPIQDYSIPIKNLSDKKINIIRIYARADTDVDGNLTCYDKVKDFMSLIDVRWQEYVKGEKEKEKEYKERLKKREESLKYYHSLEEKFK